jgi:hypothetical protein
MKFIKPVPIIETGTFARATTGAWFDEFGVLQTAAINTVRSSYEPEVRLLLEPSATNLLTYSEDFTHWTGPATLGTANTVNGITLALVSDTDAAIAQYRLKDTTVPNDSATYRVSLFLKQSDTDNLAKIYIQFINGAPAVQQITINFDAKTAISQSGVGFVFREVATGLFRLEAYAINNSTGNTVLRVVVYPCPSSGTQTASVYAGGAQVELGNYTTSYIKTMSAAVTRYADINTTMMLGSVTEPYGTEVVWNAATAYTVGMQCILTATHKIYECAIANTNFIPSSNITGTSPKWFVVGATNRWRVFDEVYGSTSDIPSVLGFIITPYVAADSLALLNIKADTVTVVVTDVGPVVTLVKTFVLTGLSDFIISDLGMTATSSITIQLRVATGNVRLGKLVLGSKFELGTTQYGVKTGINDYSTKTIDAWGGTTIVKRRYSKRQNVNLVIDNARVDLVYNTLAAYRSTPLVWIGADNLYSMMIQYGYYQSFEIDVQYYLESYCTLEITGLT